VTLIIMEVFYFQNEKAQRGPKDDPDRGMLESDLLKKAWRNTSATLFKTVRKFFGEAVVVTQEIEDIISSPSR
jgi:hypothetical protein